MSIPGLQVELPGNPSVYYSPDSDNFYDRQTNRGMGEAFYVENITAMGDVATRWRHTAEIDPAYDSGAMFRCDQGCGSFRRDRCGVHRGRLHCPICRYVGTLKFTPEKEKAGSWMPIEDMVTSAPIWVLKYDLYQTPGHPSEFCEASFPGAIKFTSCHGWYETEVAALKAQRHFPNPNSYRLEKVYKRVLREGSDK